MSRMCCHANTFLPVSLSTSQMRYRRNSSAAFGDAVFQSLMAMQSAARPRATAASMHRASFDLSRSRELTGLSSVRSLLEAAMQSRLLHETDGQRTFVVVLGTGDEVLSSLQDFVERERIHAAALTAIGALKRCDLAVLQLGDENIR